MEKCWLEGTTRGQLAQPSAQSRSNFKVESVLKVLLSQAVSISTERDFTDLCGQYVPVLNHPHGEFFFIIIGVLSRVEGSPNPYCCLGSCLWSELSLK